MMNVKITKRENYETLRDLLAEACRDELITAEESERLDEFLAHEIEQLDKRAESAKKYAEKKKTDTDPIAEAVEAVLAEAVWGDHVDQSDDFQFVYAQMKNLRRKLAEAGADIEIKSIYGFGYRLNVSDN